MMKGRSQFPTLLIASLACVPGCMAGTTKGDLSFSPDGTYVSYLQQDRFEEPWVDGKVWSRKISLHWCRARDPSAESIIAIDTLGAEFRSYVLIPCLEAQWSPDSSRIGVLTPHKLAIVEIDSGKKTEIRDGRIMGFGWPSGDEVAFCTRRARAGMQRGAVCRQSMIDQRRTEVVALPEYPGKDYKLDYSWRTHWSPSGRYVIFFEPRHRGQYHCVNLLDGSMRAFGQKDAFDESVAWTPDSARAFCVSGKVGSEEGYYEAILFEPATGKTVDCTAGFQAAFGRNSPSVPASAAPAWTPDGKYVVANGSPTGGILIRPDPWRVVPLGQIAAAMLRIQTRPWLFRLPVAGWVGVVPTGNVGDSPVKYAADYSGQQIRPIMGDEYNWAFSPDGTMIATFGPDGHVLVRNLDRQWAPGAGTPASSPSGPPKGPEGGR